MATPVDLAVSELLEERRFDEAEKRLKAALSLTPDLPECHRARALLEISTGADPLEVYHQYLGANPPTLEDRVFFIEAARSCLERVLLGFSPVPLRCQAAEFLGRLQNRAAVDALWNILADDDVTPGFLFIRRAAAEALASIGGRAKEALSHFLRDHDPVVRRAALVGLGDSPLPAREEAISRALRFGSPGERAAVCLVLGQTNDHQNAHILKPLLQDPAESVRLAAARALSALGSTEEEAEVFRRALLTEQDPKAARLLGCLGDKKSMSALIDALLAKEEGLAVAAALSLGELGLSEAIRPLGKAAAGERIHLAVAAVEALGELGDPAAVPLLVPCLSEGDRQITVIKALGRLGGPGVLPILLDLLILAKREGGDFPLLKAVISALGMLGDSAAVPALLAALQGRDGRLHAVAAEALGQLGDPAATPALLAALSSQDTEIRTRAARALASIGDESSLPEILRLLAQPELASQVVAAYVLGSLAYVDLPFSG